MKRLHSPSEAVELLAKPCRGLGHLKWSHVLTRDSLSCYNGDPGHYTVWCTDPGPYPDSAPRPPPPCRGSPWTAPAPCPPSPGASSSCWSRSGLPLKTRGLSSSELRQIASSHSFLSNPPEGGEAAINPLRPSHAVKQKQWKPLRVYSGANSPSVQNNPKLWLEMPRELCHPGCAWTDSLDSRVSTCFHSASFFFSFCPPNFSLIDTHFWRSFFFHAQRGGATAVCQTGTSNQKLGNTAKESVSCNGSWGRRASWKRNMHPLAE